MDRDVLLKKNIIGGFDKKDVMNYINSLQQNCNDRKVKNEIDDMRLRVAALREVLKEKDKQISALNHEIETLNAENYPEENSADKFDVLKRSSENVKKAEIEAEDITAQISADIKSKEDKISALFAKLSSVNEEINSFNDSLSVLSDKISDVPFEPVTEKDVEPKPMPEFDFDKVMEAISAEKAQLASAAAAKAKEESDRRHEILRSEIEAKLHKESEAKVRLENELKLKQEAETKARKELEYKLHLEAEARAKAEKELLIKKDAEEKAKAAAELKAKVEAEERAKLEKEFREEAEAKIKAEKELKEKIEADARAKIEKEYNAKIENERKARLEIEKQLEDLEKQKTEAYNIAKVSLSERLSMISDDIDSVEEAEPIVEAETFDNIEEVEPIIESEAINSVEEAEAVEEFEEADDYVPEVFDDNAFDDLFDEVAESGETDNDSIKSLIKETDPKKLVKTKKNQPVEADNLEEPKAPVADVPFDIPEDVENASVEEIIDLIENDKTAEEPTVSEAAIAEQTAESESFDLFREKKEQLEKLVAEKATAAEENSKNSSDADESDKNIEEEKVAPAETDKDPETTEELYFTLEY